MDVEFREISDIQFKELVCVSRQDTGHGGYKKDLLCQNFSALEESLLLCPSCNGVMRDSSVWEGKTTCHDCCENTTNSACSVLHRKNINELQVKCPLEEGGCPWSGKLCDIKNHLALCKYLSVECHYAKFGCRFKSVIPGEVARHVTDSMFEHLEMRMNLIELDNAQLRNQNTSIKLQLNALMKKAPISKFVESLKMCLQGAEWSLKGHEIMGSKGEIVGPDFYIRGYHLQLVGQVEDNLVLFRVRRISGEFDSCISPGTLMYSSIDQRSKEKTTNNTHNHRLDIGVLTEPIYQSKCTDSVNRFYFHIELC
ncbi:TNF receptor-associated factor 4-like [Oopsacas minuta]|uniref:TNF receptor-associated factor 4-like n=1 Tax=Oopsacas minuta TaxID=111878 RepID=A0AAV7KAK1_9METZ|nr:TNF receptor-associated factor 4-like [Oopsacas minuta]